mgnify:CR=1 FL=1
MERSIESQISEVLKPLGPPLADQIKEYSICKEIQANTELLREGQYIKLIPIVIQGIIKVFTKYEDRELLLYYIQPKESCIMSFSACIHNQPSQVYAIAEETSTVLLLPVEKAIVFMKQYPNFNRLFFELYNKRYIELLDTIHHVLFDKMDKRLYEHIKNKSNLLHENPIKISHQQLANELGTVREVVTRLLKKLEIDGLISQEAEGIRVK